MYAQEIVDSIKTAIENDLAEILAEAIAEAILQTINETIDAATEDLKTEIADCLNELETTIERTRKELDV